jgi:hypothetical protein
MPALAQAATTSRSVGHLCHIAQVTDRGTAVVDASIRAREYGVPAAFHVSASSWRWRRASVTHPPANWCSRGR